MIKYAESGNKSNRHGLRKEFWKQLLPLIKDTKLFSNVNPTTGYWLNSGAGISGLNYTFVCTGKYSSIELGISTSIKEQNKKYFEKLFKQKEIVELGFGKPLLWEKLPEHKMGRIKYEKT